MLKESDIIDALKTVFDPEIPVNVYDLGLIYKIDIESNGKVNLQMTLTNPNCPVADELPAKVAEAVQHVQGVSKAHVELVFDPPWSKDNMSDGAMLELGLF
ncbi:MAG: SUF system Fe-S cluster assembly protein [Bacteroidia bacterium]|nr:MAG: SUF system Fe-S cluster assembly protein [Bacteroidia bacterium]